MEKTKRRRLITGLCLLLAGIILFTAAAALSLSEATAAESSSLLHAFAASLFKTWHLWPFLSSLILTIAGCACLTKLILYPGKKGN